MDKEDVVHIHNEIQLSPKKEWNNAICSNTDEPRDYHTKWSMPDRERIGILPCDILPCDIPDTWNLKYCTNELTY